ncbi:MAG: hypothetical protein ACREM6_03925, partial [Vulcanimicrobiaceae bacterium]
MDVGAALVDLALAHGRDAIAVVGTAKNVGKTVAFAAICDALERRETVAGVVAIGRDGEAVDALDAAPKPRLRLRAGTLLATAQALVGRHPALELVAESDETSALGRIVIARVRRTGTYEFAGPPTARGVRRIVDRLREHGARTVAIDGAIDRIAALRD